MPHETSAEIIVTPFQHGPEKKTNLGAVITGADLGNLSETSFQKIREAVYKYGVVVLKGQTDLPPRKQSEFARRFDPDAPMVHGFGIKSAKEVGVLAKKKFYHIPDSGGVSLIGDGYLGEDHYGLPHVTLTAARHADFHADPLSREEADRGFTRFNEFHFDGIIHGKYPSRVTTFRAVGLPQGPDLTIRFDDGTGHTMACQPGSTAFLSCAQIYDLLTDDEKRLADHSFWQPAPHPFAWVGSRKMRSTGLGMAPGGATVPMEALPAWDPADVFTFPLVWLNPVTGAKGLQVMPDIVQRLYLKEDAAGPERVVDDLEEIRLFFNKIYDRILTPEYIVAPPVEEGDIVAWNNWGVMHSGIEFPPSYGRRVMHQFHVPSSTPPVGPQNAPAAAAAA